MNEARSRLVYATLLALVSAMAAALLVLLAYLLADVYLGSKGLLAATPAQELAHVRMRDLLLVVGMPLMGAAGFAVGWFTHIASEPPAGSTPPAGRAERPAPGDARPAATPAPPRDDPPAADRTQPPGQ